MPRVGPLLAFTLLAARARAAPAPAPADACKAPPKQSTKESTKAPSDPLAELRRTSRELTHDLKRHLPDWSPEAEANTARIDKLLAEMLDYEAIAQQALGPRWDALTPAQRGEFLSLFSPLTNRALIAAAARGVSVSYDSETISGPEATVVVTPRSGDAALAHIEYKLRAHCSGWRIHDVVLDGESLVDGYRAQIDKLFRHGTFEDLLAVMRRKLGDAAP
jgi:phospholipid transport system substrate-binding protein